jgi:Ser/Thr protein kinase RdoA (MazF antagonist)
MLAGDTNQNQIQLETLINAYMEFTPFNPSELALIEQFSTLQQPSIRLPSF